MVDIRSDAGTAAAAQRLDPEVDEEIEVRLALVAHEVRTPLAIIASAADTLGAMVAGDDPDLVEVARVAEVVQRHAMLAARLVGRLGMAEDMRTEPVDLVRLAEDLVDDVATFTLRSRRVTVASTGPMQVVADPSAVSEILFNLLVNASKYSPSGSPIHVAIDRHDAVARLVVRNHGGGVAPADIDRLFEVYAQADPSVTGSGLGLFVSRSLARAQGGELSVRPAAREGSEFVLELPAAEE